jgi:hypothetical protein
MYFRGSLLKAPGLIAEQAFLPRIFYFGNLIWNNLIPIYSGIILY